jgi:hypothetical protein
VRIGRDARRATTRPGTAARVTVAEIDPSETREREGHVVQRATRDVHAIAGDETRAPREPSRAEVAPTRARVDEDDERDDGPKP